ncbi:CD9 protein, partial [Polypterus senegalus]
MGLGLWLRFGPSTQGIFNIDIETPQFKIGVLVLIATGAVILAVAILGCCGVSNESRVLLAIVADQLSKFYETIYLKYVKEKDPSLVVTLKILQNGVS